MLDVMSQAAFAIPNYLGFEKQDCQIDFNGIHPGDHAPLTNQKIKVLSKGLFFKSEIGVFETDREGKFSFHHQFVKWPYQSSQTLVFQVFEETMTTKSKWTFPEEERLIFVSKHVLPIKDSVIDDLEVDLYEFEEDFPRLKLPQDPSYRAQQWDVVDYFRIIKASLSATTTDLYASLLKFIWGDISIEKLREIGDVEKLNFKISPQSTLNIVLNGICPNLKQVSENSYISEIKWKNYEFTHENDMPDATLFAFKDSDDDLQIEKITLQYRNEELKSFYPTDADFDKILFKYNSLALTKGSLAHHLGTHLEVGMYTIGVKRHLNKNPVGNLLQPFLRGVLEINQRALGVIIETLTQSGLTEKGVWQNLTESVAGCCWSNFKFQKPISKEHRLSEGSILYGSIVKDSVDQFFKENMEEIINHWYEIHAMSEALVNNSLAYQPYDDREDEAGTKGREFINGAYKAVRPITKSTDHPTGEEIEKLKEFCKYLIQQASFGHWTLHVAENIGLDPQFARFAPDSVEEDELIKRIQNQMTLGKILTDFDEGSLVENPNGDIYKPFIDRLKNPETVQLFAEQGYDINDTFYGTII